jgi:hypothetical protein
MNSSVTFNQLETVLTDLGFHKKTIPETGVAYEHPFTETLLVVREHRPDEIVPWHVLASTRHHLEWRGVIEPADFEKRLKAIAA